MIMGMMSQKSRRNRKKYMVTMLRRTVFMMGNRGYVLKTTEGQSPAM
jgi:hypothetical protein